MIIKKVIINQMKKTATNIADLDKPEVLEKFEWGK